MISEVGIAAICSKNVLFAFLMCIPSLMCYPQFFILSMFGVSNPWAKNNFSFYESGAALA